MAWPLISWAVSAGLLAVVGWAPRSKRRPATLAVGGLTLVSVAVGVWTLPYPRWPLVPLTLGTLLAAGVAAARLGRRPSGRRGELVRRVAVVMTGLAAVGLLLVGGGTAWAFPVVTFPSPGPALVGTSIVEWADDSRSEPETVDPDDHRFVTAQLWYPAANDAGGSHAWYLGRSGREARTVADGVAHQYGVPAFLLGEVARARGDGVVDAPPPPGAERYPIVLFSPGLSGVRMQNTAWAEHLASQG